MKLSPKVPGFTLLELIIVIVIVGVLAGLALPRLFRLVEYTRSTEALVNISAIRHSIEIEFMKSPSLMTTCLAGPFGSPDDMYKCLDLENLDTTAGAHFSYNVDWIDPSEYSIRATRNAVDSGNVGDKIIMTVTSTTIDTCGTGAFNNIGPTPCP